MAIRPIPDYSRPVFDVLGLPFDAVDLQTAVRLVTDAVQDRTPLFVSTPNLNFLIASQSDMFFKRSVYESDLSLADGMPVIWLARLLGIPLKGRVAGSDLFEALCEQSERTVKVFFFGGPDGAAQKACERVNAMADARVQQGVTPGVLCVGWESPGFGSLDEMSRPELIERINATGADFVVVALGARKGQAWIQRNRAQLDAPVISHLGAVVNMAAGSIARAPQWMRRVGLEWVWRIKEEPTLWKRYASDGLVLLRLLVTKIAPQLWWRLSLRLGARRWGAAPALEGVSEPGRCRWVLRGVWTDEEVQRLRDQLQRSQARGERPVFDLRRASHLASSVRGLMAIASRDGEEAGS